MFHRQVLWLTPVIPAMRTEARGSWVWDQPGQYRKISASGQTEDVVQILYLPVMHGAPEHHEIWRSTSPTLVDAGPKVQCSPQLCSDFQASRDCMRLCLIERGTMLYTWTGFKKKQTIFENIFLIQVETYHFPLPFPPSSPSQILFFQNISCL